MSKTNYKLSRYLQDVGIVNKLVTSNNFKIVSKIIHWHFLIIYISSMHLKDILTFYKIYIWDFYERRTIAMNFIPYKVNEVLFPLLREFY